MFALGRSLGRTEPETAQPAVGHGGPRPAHHHRLLSASHIHGATALYGELESSTGALALCSSGGQRAHKAAAPICACLQEVMPRTLCAESCGWNAERGVTQGIIHRRPLPSHSQVTLPDCSRSGIRLKQENSEPFGDVKTNPA